MKRDYGKFDFIWPAVLFAFWLAFSGHYDFFHTFVGALSSLGIWLMHRRLFAHEFFSDQKSPRPLRPAFFFFVYVPWLFYQIVIAAWIVAKAVLKPKPTIEPALLRFSTRLTNNTAKVILANSITLTPGTITVLLDGEEFLIHGLMEASYAGLVDGSFQGMIARIHDRRPGPALKEIHLIKSHKDL